MQLTVKIFCSGPQQNNLGQEINIIENIAKRFPVEDITAQYVLPAGQRNLNTSFS